jgi:hypothetical protein
MISTLSIEKWSNPIKASTIVGWGDDAGELRVFSRLPNTGLFGLTALLIQPSWDIQINLRRGKS